MKKTIQLVGVVFALAILSSCYKSPDLGGLSSELVVATEVNPDIIFNEANYSKYFLVETINVVTNKPGDDSVPPAQAAKIIKQIEEEMNAKGYERIETSYDDPDVELGIIASVIRVTNTGQTCSGWWGGYPGYYPPWGGGYYPYCSTYKYETGTLLVEMVDIKNAVSEEFETTWLSASFGVLSSYEDTNVTRSLRSIEQAFEQSQYLKIN
tara:strand:+ start:53318 stop:53947 length:630 start_codon:yes stop_codon:yes gene_type:complete